MEQSESVSSAPARIAWRSLLSARMLVLIAFSLYLILGPVKHHSDIVASVFAYSALALIAIILLTVIFYGRTLARRLDVSLQRPEFDTGTGISVLTLGSVISGSPAPFLLRLSPARILPFFMITIELEFDHPIEGLAAHQLTGFHREPRVLAQPIIFPHRGEWVFRCARVSFSDQFGFCGLTWRVSDPRTAPIAVRPPRRELESLPVFTSCQRSGDLVSEVRDRQGDPLDLKPYHPSDGLRRIVWKVFAKSGELISRHPEPSMTPEGQVLLFVLADRGDDTACGAALTYLEQLELLDLQTIVGCEGLRGRPLATSRDRAEQLLIEAAWDSGKGEVHADIEALLDHMKGQTNDQTVERLLIFCSAKRLERKQDLELFLSAARAAQSYGVEPLFFVDGGNDALAHPEHDAAAAAAVITPAFRKLFISNPLPEAPRHAPPMVREFLSVCLNSHWQAILL